MTQLVSAVLLLAGFGCLAVSLWPPLLHGYGPAFLSTPAGRWTLFSGLFVSFIVSSQLQGHSRKRAWRDAWNDFATRHGGSLKAGSPSLAPVGIRQGTTAEVAVGDRTMQLSVTREGENESTRFGGPVDAPTDLTIFLVPQSAAMRLIASPTVAKFLRRQMPTERSGLDSTARREAEMLLFGDPTPTGDPVFDRHFLVRASDPVRAHTFFDDGAFRYAFLELRERGKAFTWALARDPKSGEMRMEYGEWGGVVTDGERLDRIHALMVRALERLERVKEHAA
ncbi:MAG TPA: hypothetical protein VKF80_11350 [Candidatus Eisenbacteria bacterium]|nr:hypothetical protein [Candidatus Eisenbacteria bacterium]